MTTRRVAPEEEVEVSESIYCCGTDSERAVSDPEGTAEFFIV